MKQLDHTEQLAQLERSTDEWYTKFMDEELEVSLNDMLEGMVK